MKTCYNDRLRFGPEMRSLVNMADRIAQEYANLGYTITLRQLYYQFVARGLIANRDQEYKRLGDVVNRGRLAGLIDWLHLEDRTRNVRGNQHWDNPDQIRKAAHDSYRIDLWANQTHHIEVWVEKEALAGVVQPVCNDLDVRWFSCRGYVSQSEMWGAAQRILEQINKTHYSPIYGRAYRKAVILHLGDHDPSGIDMTRDIDERLAMFCEFHGDMYRVPDIHRIALNMDQIEEMQPPPNPAKVTDARFRSYQREHGEESWELDAIEPTALSDLIRRSVLAYRDEHLWDEAVARQEEERKALA